MVPSSGAAEKGNQVTSRMCNHVDEDPPISASFISFTASSGQVNSSLHDLLDRRYTVGFRYQL